MTRAEYQKQNDEMRTEIAVYREIGTPEQIKGKLKAAEDAITSNTMTKKLLA